MNVLVSVEHGAQHLEEVDVEALCAFAMQAEGKLENTEVSVTFISNDEMAHLNQEYRGLEGPTDVLSFECDNIEDEVSVPQSAEAPYELGDIVIAPDVAIVQSKEYDTSIVEEIELLLVHGILHLCGWDHMQDAEAEAMEARERAILQKWRAREA